MSKLSFRARALDASKPMPIYLAEELPDLPDYSAINRAVPQMPSGMEKEEESEHHLQRAISGSGLIIPTPEVCPVSDLQFYERCYPPDYNMPKQHIHMQPLWEEQEMPEYDMDSEDERWLRQQRHPDLTELLFEQMMDRLEKSSGQTVVTLSEAKLLLQRADDLVIAVYDYWLNKRLTTQHPLILSVKTESRPGQSSNNPYLAFRRRTEKMQTRKNRKNDESSYEKMLKLRRELARALALLQLVAKREQAKRELVALTGALAERRHRARDYTDPPPPPPPPAPLHALAHHTHLQHRTVYAPTSYRREPFTVQQFAPPIESRQKTLLSQREKRPYKRRKHRHHAVGASGGATPTTRGEDGGSSSSEGSVGGRGAEECGPFAFRRRHGCYYQLPTSTLCGEPVAGTDLFEHELHPRHRYTLVSVSEGCIGFARRRVGRGGRVLLDRRATPLDDLWTSLPAPPDPATQEEPSDTIRYRSPKETWRDHTHSRYPWRKAFRRHLASHSHLWAQDVKGEADDVTSVFDDVKIDLDDVKVDLDDIKMELDSPKPESELEKPSLPREGVSWGGKAHAWDEAARAALRKRVHSSDSESSVDERRPLAPVELEFSQFITEVDNEWLHFRPRSPPPSPPRSPTPPLPAAEPFAVELFPQLDGTAFTTDTMTLQRLQNNTHTDEQTPPQSSESAYNVRVRDCTPPPVPRPAAPPPPATQAPPPQPPAPTKPKAPTTTVTVSSVASETTTTKAATPQAPKSQTPPKKPAATPSVEHNEKREKHTKVDRPAPSPVSVPNSNIIVEEVNEVPPQIKIDKKKPTETIEEVISVAAGVQLKTVQSVHSPLKKHIISTRAPTEQTHTLRPLAHDHLKVRLQNHLVSTAGCVVAHSVSNAEAGSSGTVVGLINAPAVGNRRHHHTVAPVSSVGGGAAIVSGNMAARRPPIVRPVQLAPTPAPATPPNAPTPVVLAPSHTIHHVAPNKLKVLHAHPLHPLAHTHRNHLNLLGGRGSIAQLPAVVSLGGGQALIKGGNALTQFIEIKGAPLGKGPHLVNVVRHAAPHQLAAAHPAPPNAGHTAGQTAQQPQPTTDNKRRQLVFDTSRTALKGNIQAVSRPHRVSVSVEARGAPGSAPTAALAGVRAPHVRHQIQLKGRTLVGGTAPVTAGGAKTAALSQAVVANLLHKNVQLPKGGQKIAISSAFGGGATVTGVGSVGSVVGTVEGSVQALTLSGAQLKARAARLHATPHRMVEVGESGGAGGGGAASTSGANNSDGTDTHRNNDTLPMEVT